MTGIEYALRRGMTCRATSALVALFCAAAPAVGQLTWSANPSRPLWCGTPQTVAVTGIAPEPGSPISTGIEIYFKIAIKAGVHERFDVEVLPAIARHQMPATVQTDAQMIAAYFAAHPNAHFAFVHDANALINDCDGDGIPSMGAGNPPCWGSPNSTLEFLDDEDLPADIRSGGDPLVGGSCQPAPRFRLDVNAPPLLNKGVVGIRVKGENAGWMLKMSATSDNPQAEPTVANLISGHAWVEFREKMVGTARFGKYAYQRTPSQLLLNPDAPGVVIPEEDWAFRYGVWFPVTVRERNAAWAVVERELANPTRWTLRSSCIDFAVEVMAAAGCPLPDASVPNRPLRSPFWFNRRCAEILANNGGNLERCGWVVAGNQNFHGADAPTLMDPGVAYARLIHGPASVAEEFSTDLHIVEHPDVSVRVGTPLALNVTVASGIVALVDFGDASEPVVAGEESTHSYGKPGTYPVRVLALQDDGVSLHRFNAVVHAKGPRGAAMGIDIPPAPPSEYIEIDPADPDMGFARTFPADVSCDWIANGEDLALLLAQWGSTAATIADIDEDGVVSGSDLAIVLAGWGADPD